MAGTLATGRKVVGPAAPENIIPDPPRERFSLQERKVQGLLERLAGLGEEAGDYRERAKLLKSIELLYSQTPIYGDLAGELSRERHQLARFKSRSQIREIVLDESGQGVFLLTQRTFGKPAITYVVLAQSGSQNRAAYNLKERLPDPIWGCRMVVSTGAGAGSTVSVVDNQKPEFTQLGFFHGGTRQETLSLNKLPGLCSTLRIGPADRPVTLLGIVGGQSIAFEAQLPSELKSAEHVFAGRLIASRYRPDWNAHLLVGEKEIQVVRGADPLKGGKAQLLYTFDLPVGAEEVNFSGDGRRMGIIANALEEGKHNPNLEPWDKERLLRQRILVVDLPERLPEEKKGWSFFPVRAAVRGAERKLTVSATLDTGILDPEFALSGDGRRLIAGGGRDPEKGGNQRGLAKFYDIENNGSELAHRKLDQPITKVGLDARGERLLLASGCYFEILGERDDLSGKSE